MHDAPVEPAATRSARRFIILSGGRTGSTWLLTLLASHPSIRHCGEVIGEWKLGDPVLHDRLRQEGLVRHVRNLLEPRPDDEAVGTKILYYHLGERYARHWGLEDLAALRQELAGDKEIRIIHLKRRNLLRALVSGVIAYKTQQYRLVHQENTAESVRVELTPERCRKMFEGTAGYIGEYDALFSEHPCCEVYYEDLVVDHREQCDRILEFLDLPAMTLDSPLRRQNDRPLSAMISNYDALTSAFADTPWKVFFDESE